MLGLGRRNSECRKNTDVMKKLTLLFDVHVDMINVKPLELGDPVQCTGNYLLGNK